MRIKTSCCLVTLLCAVAALSILDAAHAQGDDEEARHEYRIEAGPLGRALNQLATQSRVQILYEPELVAGRTVPRLVGELTVQEALGALLEDSGLVPYPANGNTIVLRPAAADASRSESSQTATIRGAVTLPDGAAAAGATVTAVSPALSGRRAAQTDASGQYTLGDLPPGRYTLTFELQGMATAEKTAAVSAEDETEIDIALELQEFKEDLVIVGSRLGSTPVESALPIKVLDREQIDRSGASTIAQALSLLPEVSINNNGDNVATRSSEGIGSGSTNSTTVQLRGLPLGTTLVLVNGRRVGSSPAFALRESGSFFDLSNIPLSMVERIEVLPHGASAVYGGDGLAGVVNIVTKRDAQGLDVRLRNGMASGFDETQASVTWGKAWSRGSLTATANYLKSGTLSASERTLTRTFDFRRFGGQDFRNSLGANPGTVYSLDGCEEQLASFGFCFLPLDQRGNLPGLDAPVAGIPAGQDGQGLTPADFAATSGIPNVGSGLDGRFFSESETTGITIQGRLEISPGIELFGDLLYSKREVPPAEAALLLGGQFGELVVPAENPFNPFGVDVGVDVLSQATGVFFDYQPELLVPTLGTRGEWRDWVWELAGSLSKDLTDANQIVQDDDALQAALVSTDPATALNVFGGDGGSFGSQELIDSLFARVGRGFRADLWQANGFVRGPLAKLPAGRVETLLGVEWERQELRFDGRAESFLFIRDVSGSDESRAAFAEIRLPLAARSGKSDGRAGELLALTGAFRVDDSDRFEETGTTETVGLEVRPTPSLLLRGSYNSAFKPLSTFSAFGATDRFPIVITDPRLGGETFVVEGIFGGGVPPGLEPETSTSRTVGLVWAPESLAGLNLSVTAWDNRLRDRLVAVDSQFIVDNEDAFPGRVIRDPQTGVITHVDPRQVNVTFTNIEGVDLGLSWRWSTRYGDFTPALAATWTGKYEEQIAPLLPLQDNLAVWRGSAWSPRWKGTTTLGWAYEDQVQATLIGRYVSDYQDPVAFATGPAAGTFQALGDFWTFDLNVDLGLGRWLAPRGASRLSAIRLNVGAVNLFDRLPDFCNACALTGGYDATQYDIRGRFAYADLRFSF